MLNGNDSNQEYGAHEDAEVLVIAEEIKKDPMRYERAKKAIKKTIEEKEKRIKSFKAVKV